MDSTTDPTVMRLKLIGQPGPTGNDVYLQRPWNIPGLANPEITFTPDQKELLQQGQPAAGRMIVNVIIEPADPATD